jgi:hypothetical protein
LKIYGEASYLQNKLDMVEEKLLAAAKILRSYNNDSGHQQSLKKVYLKLARLYFITGRHEKSKAYSEKAKKTRIAAAAH